MILFLGGLLIGLAAAAGLTRFLTSQLFGVGATDPATFLTVALIFALLPLLACYLPARRARKVEPNVALRYE